jgi:putative transcriptional regulator
MRPEWIGPRVRELRVAAGWSQAQLAERAGIGLGTVRGVEQGQALPRLPTLLALAAAFGVGVEGLTKEPANKGPAPEGYPKGRLRKATSTAAGQAELQADAPLTQPKGKGRKRKEG